ncbi:MAG TPA: hypothetical protein VF025_13085, partial [Gaiellaceae bacterium]
MAQAEIRTAAAKASAGQRGRFIRSSKLRSPTQRFDAVERRRLLQAFTAAADVPVVLVAASAGYGKSTVAAQWAAQCRRSVSWIHLDRGDNDPIRFLGCLAYALDQVDHASPELLDELSSPAPRVDEIVLPALVNDFARTSPFELILDEVQELNRPKSLALLEVVLEEIPSGSQVVLVTRADPMISLNRLRVGDEVLELRADRLAFDLDETRDLAARSELDLTEESLTLIHERTEGWPAGIALAFRAVGEAGEDVAVGIQGTHRQIADYLLDTVLARQTETERHFMLATSVLRRMTAPLCDEILESSGSSNVLTALEHSNSFVIPLDDDRGWYRYHQLFGELLRAELDRREPGLADRYLARAAAWHERDGSDPDEAFRCAREGGDFERAGRIALGSVDLFISRGQLESMRLWLLDCTDEEVESDPQLAIAAAWVYVLLGEGEKGERFANAAERGNLDLPSADGASSLRSSLANVRSALAPNGIDQMLADGEFVYAAEREAKSRWLLGGCRAIGTANVLLGRPKAAVAPLREALMLSNDRPQLSYPRIYCLCYLAFAYADTGAWSDARKWVKEAKALVEEHGFDRTGFAVIAATAKAMILSHDGESIRARHELDASRRNRQRLGGIRWLDADMDLRWGEISLDLGDRRGAQDHAGKARAALHGYPDPGALPIRLEKLDARIGAADDLHITPAELRLLPLLPTHLTVKEIAEQLHVSAATVKTHLSD